MNAEQARLAENKSREEPWHFWGPYLAERAWGTVREDYSADGDAWNYFPHEHARSRVYRWNEDGLVGICDRKGRLCFAFAFWTECDPFFHTWRSARGARCARITARTETRGIISRTSMRDRACIAGMKTGLPAFAIAKAGFVSRSPFGTSAIRF